MAAETESTPRTPTVIYRCGWCGFPVDAKGDQLAGVDDAASADAYLAAHADAAVLPRYGFCCPYGDGSYYREECPDAER